jgi:hypothetical protein
LNANRPLEQHGRLQHGSLAPVSPYELQPHGPPIAIEAARYRHRRQAHHRRRRGDQRGTEVVLELAAVDRGGHA